MIIFIISNSVLWEEELQSLLILSEYQRFCTIPTSLIVDIYGYFTQKSRNVYLLLLLTTSQAIPGSNGTLVTYLLTYGADFFLRSCQLCSHSRRYTGYRRQNEC
jgi:hypothetical protein